VTGCSLVFLSLPKPKIAISFDVIRESMIQFCRVLSYHSHCGESVLRKSIAKNDNRVRIIGGQWRGRKIGFVDGEGLRPTGDRIRETLFNWLMPVLHGARCLDVFAGSGVLGFEALSRGAAHCTLLERNAQAVRGLRMTQQQLEAEAAQIVLVDSVAWLSSASDVFDVVFIDPPFAETTLSPAALLSQLEQRKLLAEDPWIYFEQPATTLMLPPAGFTIFRQQRAGAVCYGLWRRSEKIA
jgi:16S rRNA (guanine966-N2)-methyltransferase